VYVGRLNVYARPQGRDFTLADFRWCIQGSAECLWGGFDAYVGLIQVFLGLFWCVCIVVECVCRAKSQYLTLAGFR